MYYDNGEWRIKEDKFINFLENGGIAKDESEMGVTKFLSLTREDDKLYALRVDVSEQEIENLSEAERNRLNEKFRAENPDVNYEVDYRTLAEMISKEHIEKFENVSSINGLTINSDNISSSEVSRAEITEWAIIQGLDKQNMGHNFGYEDCLRELAINDLCNNKNNFTSAEFINNGSEYELKVDVSKLSKEMLERIIVRADIADEIPTDSLSEYINNLDRNDVDITFKLSNTSKFNININVEFNDNQNNIKGEFDTDKNSYWEGKDFSKAIEKWENLSEILYYTFEKNEKENIEINNIDLPKNDEKTGLPVIFPYQNEENMIVVNSIQAIDKNSNDMRYLAVQVSSEGIKCIDADNSIENLYDKEREDIYIVDNPIYNLDKDVIDEIITDYLESQNSKVQDKTKNEKEITSRNVKTLD